MQLNQRLKAWKEKGFYLEVGQNRLKVFVVDEGDKNADANQTIVLLHGFPESSYSYAGAFPLLTQRFQRIISFDFVGFGFSEKPVSKKFTYSLFDQADVALDVWKKLGLKGCHILAHDMGTSVLTEILSRINENLPYWLSDGLKSVTFTNGGMVLSKAKLRFGQKALMSKAGFLLSPTMQSYQILRQQVKSAHGNDLLKEEQIRDLYEVVIYNSRPDLFHLLVQYLHERLRFEQLRWLPAIAQFNAPVHISWGGDDKVNPIAVAQYLRDNVCPGATLSVTKGLGHFCQIQDPEKWIQPLLEFWEETSFKQTGR